jgi:hypothetical protein
MKIYLNNRTVKFRNLLKYILDLLNINYKLTSTYISFDKENSKIVKKLHAQLLDFFKLQTNTVIINQNLTPVLSVSYNTTDNTPAVSLTGTITNNYDLPITQCGFNYSYVVKYTPQNPNSSITQTHEASQITTTLDNNSFTRNFDLTNCYNLTNIDYYQELVFNYQAFATNSFDTGYTNFYTLNKTFIPCLVENTLITLYDGSTKFIQDITYDDLLLVWNFDESKFTSAKPLWIKRTDIIKGYYCATFDDEKQLNFVNKHRIFNTNKNKFTNIFKDNMETITQDGNNIKLKYLNFVDEKVKYYNLITDYHMNYYANGILTSCRYNNIYPIKNMKFIKNNTTTKNNLELYTQKYINGMRLGEQTKHKNVDYINRLIVTEKNITEIFSNKKIIFLDHGGVMIDSISNLKFDIRNINIINQLVEQFSLNIVISSDWTEFITFENLILLYEKCKMKIPLDYTHKHKYNILNKSSLEEIRANEINNWILENNYDLKDIIIMDDLDLTKFFSTNNFMCINKKSLYNHF